MTAVQSTEGKFILHLKHCLIIYNFHEKGFSTKTLFETEAQGNSEMAY